MMATSLIHAPVLHSPRSTLTAKSTALSGAPLRMVPMAPLRSRTHLRTAPVTLAALQVPQAPSGPGWSADKPLKVDVNINAVQPQIEQIQQGAPGSGHVRILGQTHGTIGGPGWPANFMAALSQLAILRELQAQQPAHIFYEGLFEHDLTDKDRAVLRTSLRKAVRGDDPKSTIRFLDLLITHGAAQVYAALAGPAAVQVHQGEPPDRRRRHIAALKKSQLEAAKILFDEREMYVLRQSLRTAQEHPQKPVFIIYGVGHDFSRRAPDAVAELASKAAITWENYSGYPHAEVEGMRIVGDEYRQGLPQRRMHHDYFESAPFLRDPYLQEVLRSIAALQK